MAHKKKNVRKKNTLYASVNLAGPKSLIKTGTVWCIVQMGAAELKSTTGLRSLIRVIGFKVIGVNKSLVIFNHSLNTY